MNLDQNADKFDFIETVSSPTQNAVLLIFLKFAIMQIGRDSKYRKYIKSGSIPKCYILL